MQTADIVENTTLKTANDLKDEEWNGTGNQEEIWLPIKNYENCYEVSNYGRIKSLDRISWQGVHFKGKILKGTITFDGYKTVNLTKNGQGKRLSVHRLVAQTFIPNPNNLRDVNHKNFDRIDNRVENLQWMSSEENIKYSIKNGRCSHLTGGNMHSRSKLTKEQVDKIRKEYLENELLTHLKLSKKYNLSKSAISALIQNRSWFDEDYEKHVISDKYKKRNIKSDIIKGRKRSKLTKSKVKTIRKMHRNGFSNIDISRIFTEIAYTTVCAIVSQRTWKEI